MSIPGTRDFHHGLLGLIWVFNGEKPLYPVPSFEAHVDMPNTIWRVFESTEDHRADPWWIITTNAFDFQHLRFVHGLADEFAMLKDIELDVTDQGDVPLAVEI